MMHTKDYFEQFMESRGLSDESLAALDEGPRSYPAGTDDVCAYLHGLDRNTCIGILSDFDCDGLMSGIVWFLGLHFLGFGNVFICERDASSGYAVSRYETGLLSPAQLVVTSDVGVSCVDAVREMKARGQSVIVTDHHLCEGKSTRGIADFFIDPSYRDRKYKGPAICGAMVVYLVFERYFDLYPEGVGFSIRSDLAIVRHFAAIATVSDSMPMRGRNREAVRRMFRFFAYMAPVTESSAFSDLACDPVLQNVLNNAYRFIKGLSPEYYTGFDGDFLSFQMIPVLNSVKRMGGDVSMVYTAFFGDEAASRDALSVLVGLNTERKAIVERVSRDLEEKYSNGALAFNRVFILDGVPAGICGLIAQKMTEFTGGPAIALMEQPDGSFSGSARSVLGYQLLTSVNESGTARCAGHQAACGVSVGSFAHLVALDAFLTSSFDEFFAGLSDGTAVRPAFDVLMDYDADFLRFHRRLRSFCSRCQDISPFGPGFPAPNVCLRFDLRDGVYSGFGLGGTAHTLVNLGSGFSCKLWNTDVSMIRDCARDGIVHVCGTVSRVSANGRPAIVLTGALLPDAGTYDDRYVEDDGGSFDVALPAYDDYDP